MSAGSFLYVATIHVLPEVYCNMEVHRPHFHTHIQEQHNEEKENPSKITEMLIIIGGFFTPLLLTILLPDED